MALPQKYRNYAEPSIISYNWQDIADGSGYITLYCGGGENSDGVFYGLYQTVLRTSEKYKSATVDGNETDFVKGIDLDFDMSQFNTTRILEGKAVAGISWYKWGGGGGIDTLGYYKIVLKKVKTDDTEEDIATFQTHTEQGNTNEYVTSFLEADIPSTKFKVGEKLRATVEGWWYQRSGLQPTIPSTVYFDPENLESEDTYMAEGKTQLFIHIPCVIDK